MSELTSQERINKKLSELKDVRRFKPKEMESEKPVIIKLTDEQIEEKRVQLVKTQMNLEMAELNVVQFERAVAENIPMREAKIQLANLKKQIEMLKHNIVALNEQISKGEM